MSTLLATHESTVYGSPKILQARNRLCRRFTRKREGADQTSRKQQTSYSSVRESHIFNNMKLPISRLEKNSNLSLDVIEYNLCCIK